MKFITGALMRMSLILIALPSISHLVFQPAPVPQTAWAVTQYNCDDVFNQFTENADYFEQLINPTITADGEITERLDLYAKVYACIGSDTAALPDDLLILRTLTEYFLIFAGGFQTPESETRLVLTTFEESDDPAIVKIRDQAGIPAPEGYIFVRFYSSREVMPDLVKKAFKNAEVAGVTILIRYVAVLAEEKLKWQEQVFQSQTLPETISHELSHAYLNAALGYQGDDLPKWYHEGVAIYFSGSGEGHSFISPDLALSTTPTEEYRQYDLMFKYLEAKLGRKQMLERIKHSVERADPASLYQGMGIMDEHDLAARANARQQWRSALNIIPVALVLLALMWGIKTLMPDIRCKNCSYAGKKNEFARGYCPKCYRPYDRIVRW